MEPCLTVGTEGVLWRAEYVVGAGDDGDQDSGDGDHLVCEIEDREDWQQVVSERIDYGTFAYEDWPVPWSQHGCIQPDDLRWATAILEPSFYPP